MNLPPGKYLAKHQPCGCIICTCEDEMRCHGCGAKHCGTHPLGQLPDPIFEDRPEEATPETDAATHDDWSGGTPAVEVETCKRLERERNRYKDAIVEAKNGSEYALLHHNLDPEASVERLESILAYLQTLIP